MHYQLCVHMFTEVSERFHLLLSSCLGEKLLLYYKVSISNSQAFKEYKKSVLETKASLSTVIYKQKDIKSLSLSCQRSKMGGKPSSI